MKTIICGGGVIGTCTAYYLSRRGIDVSVVERTGIANASSGKSGGFLALDWCRGTPVDPLARRSFALHAELDTAIDIDWGYRRVETLGVAASPRRDLSRLWSATAPGWLGENAAVHGQLGTPETTAQVTPDLFTQAMMTASGAALVEGAVDGIILDGGCATGVLVDGNPLEADAVVIAMGPWSILACQWLPLPGVYGLKGHSLVFRYTPETPRALFVELEDHAGEISTPEVMPRPDGTTYVCGLSGEAPLPVDPAHVGTEEGGPEKLQAMTSLFAPELGAAEVIASQACYRPVTQDGMPVIGAVTGVEGAYVATGHSVWGMLNGPATGEAMAELIVDGAASTVDISPFAPERLPVLDAGALSVQN
ncbi:MAG: D-amino-acid oxidase [Rhodospirillaceae bacterium]|nr:D-amino-acid oxidase [Rhodospirillaceae bacterium]